MSYNFIFKQVNNHHGLRIGWSCTLSIYKSISIYLYLSIYSNVDLLKSAILCNTLRITMLRQAMLQGSQFNRTVIYCIEETTFTDLFVSSFLSHAICLSWAEFYAFDYSANELDAFSRPMKTTWRPTIMNWTQQRSKAATVS